MTRPGDMSACRNLADAEVIPYALPLAAPYRTARGTRETRRGFLLRLRGRDGVEGWGDAAPLRGRTETLEQAADALGRAAAALPDGGGGSSHDVLAAFPGAARPAARFAIGLALADLAARRAGIPLAEWWVLGVPGAGADAAVGHDADRRSAATAGAPATEPGPPPLARIPVNATLSMSEPGELLAQAERAVAEGIRCVKLKVGADAEADVRRISALRSAFPDLAIRLDANEAWTRAEGRDRVRELRTYRIEYVEQPLPRTDLEGMAALRRSAHVRIAADESAGDIESVKRVVDAGAADVLVLKPAVLGAVRDTFAAAHLGREAGMEVVITSALDSAVGRWGALHVAAALGPPLGACGLATGRLLAADVAPPEAVVDGTIRISRGPGLGIDPRVPS